MLRSLVPFFADVNCRPIHSTSTVDRPLSWFAVLSCDCSRIFRAEQVYEYRECITVTCAELFCVRLCSRWTSLMLTLTGLLLRHQPPLRFPTLTARPASYEMASPCDTCIRVCRLPEDQILDRVAMLNRVEPNASMQAALYADPVHFAAPDVYHAFNWQLLDRLAPLLATANQSSAAQLSGCMSSMHTPIDSALVTGLAALTLAFIARLFP